METVYKYVLANQMLPFAPKHIDIPNGAQFMWLGEDTRQQLAMWYYVPDTEAPLLPFDFAISKTGQELPWPDEAPLVWLDSYVDIEDAFSIYHVWVKGMYPDAGDVHRSIPIKPVIDVKPDVIILGEPSTEYKDKLKSIVQNTVDALDAKDNNDDS